MLGLFGVYKLVNYNDNLILLNNIKNYGLNE